jgi:transposase-like protein
MPKLLGSEQKQDILRLAAMGNSHAEIARQVGCSRPTVARVIGRGSAPDRTTMGKVIHVRMTPLEFAALERLALSESESVSGMLRRLVRRADGVVDYNAEELAVLGESSRALNALARNLVQIVKMGQGASITWNARDAKLVASLSERTQHLASAVQSLRLAGLRRAYTLIEDIVPVTEHG